MFSIFPPFYYGLHNAFLGWFSLLFVILMHVFCFVRRWDGERSLWSYFYYFFHVSCLVWIVVSLIVGYSRSYASTMPSGMTE